MIVFKLVAVFFFSYLLTGCYLWGDYNSLKRDIRTFKAYLRAFPPPSECQTPGTPQTRICYYRLSIEPVDPAQEMFKGHIPKDVVEKSFQECTDIKTKNTDNKDFPEDFSCDVANPKYYRHVWYGFKLHDKSTAAGTYDLINEAQSVYLRPGKPDEAQVNP